MSLKIGIISQKGGVGKSTLARMIACEYASAGWQVKIADMDTSQGTSYQWNSRRLVHKIEPVIAVEQFANTAHALRVSDNYDLMIFDGAPHSNTATMQIAKASNLIILPTGIALDDLEPTVRLAHELKRNAIESARIAVAFCRVGDSTAELEEAAAYIQKANYFLLKGSLPERTGYRRASDAGRTVTETAFNSLNDRAGELMQSVVDRVKGLERRMSRNAKG